MEREPERLYSPAEIAAMTNGAVSERWVRQACNRPERDHRLPHIRCGSKRPHVKISRRDFEQWLEEEKRCIRR